MTPDPAIEGTPAGFQAEWLDDGRRVVLVTMARVWTWADYADAIWRLRALAGEETRRVDAILDLTARPGLPHGPAVAHIGQALQNMPSHFGLLVLVSERLMIHTMVAMARQSYPAFAHQVLVVDALDEAQWAVREHRLAHGTGHLPPID
jgi:hypothetical protein